MKASKEGYDPTKLRELTSAVMDGIATEAEQRELTDLLGNDVSARDDYLALVDIHALLSTELAGVRRTQRAKPSPSDTVATSSGAVAPLSDAFTPLPNRKWLPVAGIVALAASLLIAIVWIYLRKGDSQTPNDVAFATVVQLTDAEWASGTEIDPGDRVGPKRIQLKSGFVRLAFDSGVEVTLQGPADFELLTAQKAKFTSGLLAANVPPEAEGFTVDTPTAEVVDFGTSFGIDLRDDGFSNVAVFDGVVEVALPDAIEKHRLTEGDSIRIGVDQQVEKVEIEPERYEKVWPISSGIAGSTKSFRVLPPWPKRLHFVRSDRDIFVAVEGYAVELDRPLQVNISEPGDYQLATELTPLELKSGKRVRSYILHFHPETQLGVRRAQRVSGSITFARPVVGLIMQHEQLLATSRRFTPRAAGEVGQRRQLDLTGELDGDHITLSEDRRTVTVDLISPGRSSDLMRVIVDASIVEAAQTVDGKSGRLPLGGVR